MTLSIRHVVLIAVCAAIAAAAATYTISTFVQPPLAGAGHTAGSDRAVVRELRAIKSALADVEKQAQQTAQQANNTCRLLTEYPATNCGFVSSR